MVSITFHCRFAQKHDCNWSGVLSNPYNAVYPPSLCQNWILLRGCLPGCSNDPALLLIHHFFGQVSVLQEGVIGVSHSIIDFQNLVRADVNAMHAFDAFQRIG
jgi:hypothetical protein